MMIARSKRHLADVDESYGEHLRVALGVSALMLRAGIACTIHAIIPGLCTRTASGCLARIQQRFAARAPAARDDRTGDSSPLTPSGRLPAAPGPVLSG